MKKRLFRSNLLMVAIPLTAFIIIGSILMGILMTFFSSDFSRTYNASESLPEIQELIDSTDMDLLLASPEAQNALLDAVADKGFRLWAEQDGKALFTNMDNNEQSYIVSYMSSVQLQAANQTVLDRTRGTDLLWHRIETDGTPLVFVAISTSRIEPFGSIGIGSFTTIIVSLVVIVLIVVAVSLILASKMVKKIMVPLDSLCDGASRIRDGNFDEDIDNTGIDELAKVCDSFNDMQHQLKENIRKNEKYEQDRREMLAGISHDLRTPLTSIKSYVKGLQDEVAKTPEKQKEYLEIAYRKACEMEGLIDQLFLFSKLETGNLPFNFHSVVMQNYIATLLDLMQYDLNKNGIILTLNSTCSSEKVLLDTEQMTRALQNILGNSIKYNPDKAINITFTLTTQDDTIIMRIQDDGVGVSDEQLSRLFESFYRADESRTNSADGSGLGLAIAKNIVAAHGGSIFAENQNGLTIVIELPIEKEESK